MKVYKTRRKLRKQGALNICYLEEANANWGRNLKTKLTLTEQQ